MGKTDNDRIYFISQQYDIYRKPKRGSKELKELRMKMIKDIIPNHHQMTKFLRGQESKIFDNVAQNNKVVLVNKNSKPQNIIISDRYCCLKENSADI